MAPIDSNIIVLSNRVSSTFESTPLKHRQIGVSRINKCKFTFFFFSLFPSISFFPFIFVNFVYFFFSPRFVFSFRISFRKFDRFTGGRRLYKNSRELYTPSSLDDFSRSISFPASRHLFVECSPILYALILEFNELAVINISDKIRCPSCPRDF